MLGAGQVRLGGGGGDGAAAQLAQEALVAQRPPCRLARARRSHPARLARHARLAGALRLARAVNGAVEASTSQLGLLEGGERNLGSLVG